MSQEIQSLDLAKSSIQNMESSLNNLFKQLKLEEKMARKEEVAKKMESPDFWVNQVDAKKLSKEFSDIGDEIKEFESIREEVVFFAINFEEYHNIEPREALADLNKTIKKFESFELSKLLNEEADSLDAIVTINAGAGGTEACDWAGMVFRMYTRWAEGRGYKVSVESVEDGKDSQGISNATFKIEGKNAFGYLKSERGVHRLVRISPFDANDGRHTSFCSVDIVPVINEDIKIDIQEKDLKIDVYCSSGNGGQHVQKTESAVRITHLPTKIVCTCQRERSQATNRKVALEMLKSKLYAKLLDEKKAEVDQFYIDKGENGWGNQIRSYVFQPQQMIKDIRTGYTSYNAKNVMDGDLDGFIFEWLKQGKPTKKQHNDE